MIIIVKNFLKFFVLIDHYAFFLYQVWILELFFYSEFIVFLFYFFEVNQSPIGVFSKLL